MHTDIHALSHLGIAIAEKRRATAHWIEAFERNSFQWHVASIVCGAIAGALATGPAFGGKAYAETLATHGGLRFVLLAWAVMLTSFGSAISAGFLRYLYPQSRLAAAETADAKLEVLETEIRTGRITLKDAGRRFDQIVLAIPFIRRLPEQAHMATGCILQPIDGAEVSREIECFGTAGGVGDKTSLWLAVETGGYIWYKEEPLDHRNDGTWSRTVFEDGSGGDISISLWAASPAAEKRIRAWLEECERHRDKYKGLQRIPGAVRLDRVGALRIAKGDSEGAPREIRLQRAAGE